MNSIRISQKKDKCSHLSVQVIPPRHTVRRKLEGSNSRIEHPTYLVREMKAKEHFESMIR